MKILTLDDAAKVLGASDIASFFGGIDWQYPDPVPSYFLSKDSGAKGKRPVLAACTRGAEELTMSAWQTLN